LRMNWNAGIAQDPFNDCGAYFGSQFVHKSSDCGQSWQIISPDLTTDDEEKQNTGKSGGLTIDDTQAEKYTTILSIAPSPVDANVIWVGTDDGNLQLTRDGGETWTNLANRLSGVRAGAWIPQINVSDKDAGVAYVSVNDYRRNDWKPYAYITRDYGQTWKRVAREGQVEGHVYSLLPDPVEPNLLYLGTENGLYISIDEGANWNKWTNGYPSVPTADLKIHPREHDLIIGTFGRAIYILDDIRPLREIARTKGAVLDQDFKLFEAPDAFNSNTRSVDGIRFVADAEFRGQNRRNGAMVTVWNKPSKKKDKKGMKPSAPAAGPGGGGGFPGFGGFGGGGRGEQAKVHIMDSAGDTIRSYSTRIDTGLTRIYWNMSEDGVRFPSYQDPRPNASTPSGADVLPGTYKMIVVMGKKKDSTMINVNHDPRSSVKVEALAEKQRITREYGEKVKLATEAMDRLREAQKTVKLVNNQLGNAPDSIQKMIKKEGKTVTDSIKALQRLYAFPPGTKGIQRDPEALNSVLRGAGRYIRATSGVPGQNTMHTVAWAEKEIARVVGIINDFFDTEWKSYQEKVEANQHPIFKEYERIE
ncbi:MAG: hypothetical protein KJP00_10280, partial [Bacteroidia bacterium]|nr:hypothetical protein [Bacteroidia bacterium]